MFEELLTQGTMKLAGGVFVLMAATRHVFAEAFASKIGQRLLPVLPLGFGIIGGLIGVTDAKSVADKITVGMIGGFAASHIFKVGKTTVLGWGLDSNVVEDPSKSEPEVKPVAPEKVVAAPLNEKE